MNKLVLLTGATGFVGRQILRHLSAFDVRVRVVVRNGKESIINHEKGIESIWFTEDMFAEDLTWWEEVCTSVDTIIHAAWYAEPGKYLQSPVNIDCLTGTMTMAKAAVSAGVKRLVGIGTCFEYDLLYKVLSVDTPLRPETLYAASKASVYLTLSRLLPLQGLSFAWCRLFYLYGENEDARRLVPYVRQQLLSELPAQLTSGTQIRDYMDVGEAGKQIAAIALSEKEGSVNICSGIPVTVRQLVEKIADEYGRRDLLHFGARPDNLIDPPCILGIK